MENSFKTANIILLVLGLIASVIIPLYAYHEYHEDAEQKEKVPDVVSEEGGANAGAIGMAELKTDNSKSYLAQKESSEESESTAHTEETEETVKTEETEETSEQTSSNE